MDAASLWNHHPANSCTRPVPPLIFTNTACSKQQIAGVVEIVFSSISSSSSQFTAKLIDMKKIPAPNGFIMQKLVHRPYQKSLVASCTHTHKHTHKHTHTHTLHVTIHKKDPKQVMKRRHSRTWGRPWAAQGCCPLLTDIAFCSYHRCVLYRSGCRADAGDRGGNQTNRFLLTPAETMPKKLQCYRVGDLCHPDGTPPLRPHSVRNRDNHQDRSPTDNTLGHYGQR